jgi:hypothetical protein
MAQRTPVQTHKTPKLQGEDSYVKMSLVKVGEVRALRKREATEEDFNSFEEGLKLLAAHIVEWNWVDDAGEPLPSPLNNDAVLDLLTEEEATYLVEVLMGDKEAKN